MKYRLNRKSLERLKALVRAGAYVDVAWNLSAADDNALLGDPPNWTEYQQWFLGIEMGKPESVAENGATDQVPHKDWFAYPFGKGGNVNLEALRGILSKASAAGDGDVAAAAGAVLELARERDADRQTASSAACDLDIALVAPANLRAAAAGKKGPPTFTADAYTGGPMELDGWDYPVVIDYEGIDVTAHDRPVLRDHDPKKPLGHTTRMGVDGGIFKAAGVISAVGPHVDEVVGAAKNDFPWQVSVGAKVLQNQFVPEGGTAQANGKTWSGPVNIARRTALREISILTLGADDNTSARIAAKAATKGTSMKFKSWAKAAGLKCADMTEEQLKNAKATFKAAFPDEDPDDEGEDTAAAGAVAPNIQAAAGAPTSNGTAVANAAATTAADMVKELRAAMATERQRFSAISAMLDEYRPQVDATKFAAIEAKALGGEYDQSRTELELIKARRPTVNAPNINTGAGSQVDGLIVAAVAARSMGVGEKTAYKGLDERAGNIAAGMRGLSIHGIIAMSAARLGMHVAAGSIDDGFLGDFIRRDKDSHRTQIAAHRGAGGFIAAAGATGSGFTTMSLTGITENILYKAMLEQYALQVSVVSDIAYERDTNDFKPFKVYRVTASGDLQTISPTGELKHMGLQDESYQNQVATRGALMVLKREDIINDDMGALMQVPQVFGRKAALNREKAVMTTFLSGLNTVAPGASTGKTANAFNFWSAGAKNYLSGAGSALSITSLTTAVQKFVQQTDANGDPIGVLPDRLLLCPELQATGDNLFNGANIVVTSLGATNSKDTAPNLNQHARKYRPITSPYLGASSSVTGASATQWALLPNPAGGMAPVQVGYLRGQRTPVIRQVEVDAAMLGIAYQGIFDFGTALLDFRCGVYSAGA